MHSVYMVKCSNNHLSRQVIM